MPRQSRAKLRIWIPKGVRKGPNTTAHVIELSYSDTQTVLTKDITDALRAKGYEVECTIEREIAEEY